MNAIIGTVSLMLLVVWTTTANQLDNRVKRMDVSTCSGHFDVKHDIIIRSEESVKMGAKYLGTREMISQAECAQSCCQTDSCDVFVFEERIDRSCFLFHCGPAQDFRCKFNRHENYTSAVLSTTQNRVASPTTPPAKPKVAQSQAMSKNELDLRSLKELGLKKDGEPTIASTSTTTTTTVAPMEKALAGSGKNSTSHCGRFQFQCHSGDCIAVYNACDGIPQCDDGSDEGPECQSVTRSPDTSSNKLDTNIQSASANIHLNDYKIAGHSREDPSKYIWPNSNHMPNNGFQYSKGEEIIPKTQAEHPQFISHYQLAQQQQSIQPLPQIFPANALPPNAIQSWNAGGDANLLSKWPQAMPQFPMKPFEPYGQYPADASQNQPFIWPIVAPQSPEMLSNAHSNPNTEEILPDKNTILKDVVVADRKKDGRNTLHEDDKPLVSTESSEYNGDDDDDRTTTESSKKKKKHRKVTKVDRPEDEQAEAVDDAMVAEQMKLLNDKLRVEHVEHDGAADRPSGAVISLVLGILITIGLIMMFGCQSNSLRKRVRRGKSYAHDSDFLVNGMYL